MTMKKKVIIGVVGVIAIALLVSAWLLYSYWVLQVDEFGTPRYRWRWTYGLIGGTYEVTSCEGFNTEIPDMRDGADFWETLPFFESIAGLLEGETEMMVCGDGFVLIGRGFWGYMQIRVNGKLVRHRWPLADTGNPVQFGNVFVTEPLNLNVGRNEVVLTAIWRNNFISKTIYLIP